MTNTTISSISPKGEKTIVRDAAKAANKEQRILVKNSTTVRPQEAQKS